jgi:hypothetical protein
MEAILKNSKKENEKICRIKYTYKLTVINYF